MTSKHKVIFVTLLVSVLTDQLTKLFALSSLRGRAPLRFFGDFFVLTYAENPGAMLSLGAWLSPTARAVLLIGFVAVALTFILIYGIVHKPFGVGHGLGIGLIVGGGMANLIDRIFRDGHVVDFLNLGIGRVRTGVFNVADIYIFLGVAIFGYFEIKRIRAEKRVTAS